MSLPLPRPLLAAACAVAEVALVGWWAATGATVVFIVLQLALIVLVWLGLLAGRYLRFRREHERTLAANAVLADRQRLADELHDALGHDLSLIALRAGGLQIRTTGAVQEQAAGIRQDAEAAVERLRAALAAAREPAPRESVSEMIGRLIASGASITQRGRVPARLPAAAEHVLHRTLRELLTNALRHAPGQPIAIEYRSGADVLTVEVRNPLAAGPAQDECTRGDEPGAGGGSTPGSGLPGLRRHLGALGGQLETEDRGGEFTATARIPLRRESEAEAVRTGSSPLSRTLRSAAVPALTAAGLVLGFFTWAVHNSTLEDRDFAELRVGMTASAAEERLPGRQAPVHLVPAAPHEEGWSCMRFTDGNFPLGIAVFEVCFDDGEVVRLSDLRRRPWL
ncbi:sensor histidine kinase [Brevibacterium album]|uniref:sensor histidine kinase n=1 Tax=Brevibacterium album TaxID=417948 RepID=UPI000415C0E5|nr:histidine kinase [Brevibacterium album]